MVVQPISQQNTPPASPQSRNQPSPKHWLFRQQALEQTASPEQLDLPIQIIHPNRWLSLLAFTILVSGATIWSIFGKIPIIISGKGILTHPSQITNLQSPGAGRIARVAVKEGDRVTKGQLLAVLDQSELKQQLESAQNKFLQLQFQDQAAKTAQAGREQLERTTIAKQRQALQQELQTVQAFTPELNLKGLNALDQERTLLQERLNYLRKQAIEYAQVWDRLNRLTDEGSYARNALVKDKQEYLVKPQTDILEVEAQLKQLDAKQTTAEQEHLRNINKVNELQAQLRELDSKSAGQAEQDLATATVRGKEIQETKRTIAQLELQLQQNTQVVSDYDGYVRELNLSPGQRIESGAPIGVIAANQPNAPLEGIVFLPVEEGKKLDETLGKRYSVQITPTTVKREEYGGIRGEITKVSQASITQAGAIHLVGNPAILATVMEEGKAYMTVFTKLDSGAEPGKYIWSSSNGPEQKITDGTTTTVNITIEERAPISFVIPLLKSWVSQ